MSITPDSRSMRTAPGDGPEVLRPTLGRGPAGLDEDALVEAGAREFLAADGLCRVRTAQIDDAAAADEALEPERGDVHGAAVEMHQGVDMRAHVRRHVDRRDVGNSAVVDALVPEDLERRVAREYGRSGATEGEMSQRLRMQWPP